MIQRSLPSEPQAGRQQIIIWSLRAALVGMTDAQTKSSVAMIGEGAWLFPEEEALIQSAAASRRREFAVGRSCARAALAAVGCSAVPIGRGRLCEPLWPAGFGGSITHDGRFAAALAYKSTDGHLSLALDLVDRPQREIFVELAPSFLAEGERRSLGADGARPDGLARLFSAKEAAVKIISPRIGHLIDFRDLAATPAHNGYTIHHDRSGITLRVQCAELEALIITVAHWDRRESS